MRWSRRVKADINDAVTIAREGEQLVHAKSPAYSVYNKHVSSLRKFLKRGAWDMLPQEMSKTEAL